MKYEATYSCGHTATVELYGPAKDRERKLRWMETEGLCPACYKAEQDRKDAAGCHAVTMAYKAYKDAWYWCKAARDSYDKKDKTITVYIPEYCDGLEAEVAKMARGVRLMGSAEGCQAAAKEARERFEAGGLTGDQVARLGKAAQALRRMCLPPERG